MANNNGFVLLTGTANLKLARDVAKILGKNIDETVSVFADGEKRIIEVLRKYIPDNAPTASLIFYPNGVRGRVWFPGISRPIPISEICVIGSTIQTISLETSAKKQVIDSEFFDRQILAFGELGQALISSAKVGIVGVGGTGSPTAEQLIRLGVQDFVLIDKDLFEKLSSRIDKNDKIGIASCTPYFEDEGGNRVFDSSPAWHTNGQFKIYRKECIEQIGGLVKDLGWDCADNVHAIEKGWETVVYKDLYYRLTRPIGRFSVKKGTVRQGIGAYKLRHSFIYIMLKVLHDSLRKPYFLLGIYYLQGYFRGVRKYNTRTLNKKQGKLLRKLLWNSFFERFRNKEFILQQKG